MMIKEPAVREQPIRSAISRKPLNCRCAMYSGKELARMVRADRIIRPD